MLPIDTKALKVEHAECFHHALCAGGSVKMVVRNRGKRTTVTQVLVQLVEGRVTVREPPLLCGVLGHENFAWVNPLKYSEELFGGRLRGEMKLPGRQIEPRRVEALPIGMEGEQKVVSLCVDLCVRQAGAGRDDASQLPLNELARCGRFHLVADGNLDPLVEQLLNIVIRCMKGDARHRHAVPMGEGDAKQFGAPFGILEKDFIEIAQTKQQQRIIRELGTNFVPLLHHRGEFLFGHLRNRSVDTRHSSSQINTDAQRFINRALNRRPGYASVGRPWLYRYMLFALKTPARPSSWCCTVYWVLRATGRRLPRRSRQTTRCTYWIYATTANPRMRSRCVGVNWWRM